MISAGNEFETRATIRFAFAGVNSSPPSTTRHSRKVCPMASSLGLSS